MNAQSKTMILKSDRKENSKESLGDLDPLDVQIGARVKQRRQLLGMTQKDLAEKLNVKYQQVQKYERGINRVSASTLHDVSNVLGIEIGYFYEGYDTDFTQEETVSDAGLSDNEQAPFQGDDPLVKKETMNLVRAYYSIKDDKQRKQIYDLVRSLADSTHKKD